MVSFGDKMVAANGRPAGFDYMRLVLASSVILVHSFVVPLSYEHLLIMWASSDRALIAQILPMFFALSGFLVAGSLERNKSLISFLGLRAIRLLPALAVEITLSALILGTIFTSLPRAAYFANPALHVYFLNILGDIHFYLPGVFQNNPFGGMVNAQLWTIPVEMKCYVVLAALAFVGIANRRSLLLIAMVLFQVAMIALPLVKHDLYSYSPIFPGKVLIACFLAGLTFYKYREKIPVHPILGGLSLIVTAALLLIPHGDYVIAIPSAYATIYLGTLNPVRNKFFLSGDYSYGLYLYGFPIQQAFTTLGSWTYHWWVDFPVAYSLAFGFSALSWWYIEKPALKLKRYVSTCEGWLLRVPPIEWHSRRVFNLPNPAEPMPTVK